MARWLRVLTFTAEVEDSIPAQETKIRMSNKVPEKLWMEVHDIVQEAIIKNIPKCKKAKWLSE